MHEYIQKYVHVSLQKNTECPYNHIYTSLRSLLNERNKFIEFPCSLLIKPGNYNRIYGISRKIEGNCLINCSTEKYRRNHVGLAKDMIKVK